MLRTISVAFIDGKKVDLVEAAIKMNKSLDGIKEMIVRENPRAEISFFEWREPKKKRERPFRVPIKNLKMFGNVCAYINYLNSGQNRENTFAVYKDDEKGAWFHDIPMQPPDCDGHHATGREYCYYHDHPSCPSAWRVEYENY